jgi:uncharacterized protein (DUF169 family)
MVISKQELAILDKLELPVKPVALGLFLKQPEGIDRLDEKMQCCKMFRRARERDPFYTDRENHTCSAALYSMGMKDLPPAYESGDVGARLKMFKEPRIARRLYSFISKIQKNTINYVAFSTLDKLSFKPDVLLLASDTNKAEIILRALSYTTGKMWSSKFTPVLGCAWTIVYPYVTGEVNYVIPSFEAGMKEFNVFPEGFVLISIPFELLPSLFRSLEDMPQVLPTFQPSGPEFRKQLQIELGLSPDEKETDFKPQLRKTKRKQLGRSIKK